MGLIDPALRFEKDDSFLNHKDSTPTARFRKEDSNHTSQASFTVQTERSPQRKDKSVLPKKNDKNRKKSNQKPVSKQNEIVLRKAPSEKDIDCKLRKAILMKLLLALVELACNTGSVISKSQNSVILFKCQYEHEKLKKSKSKGVEALIKSNFAKDEEGAQLEYQIYKDEQIKQKSGISKKGGAGDKKGVYDSENPYGDVEESKLRTMDPSPEPRSGRGMPRVKSLEPRSFRQRKVRELSQMR